MLVLLLRRNNGTYSSTYAMYLSTYSLKVVGHSPSSLRIYVRYNTTTNHCIYTYDTTIDLVLYGSSIAIHSHGHDHSRGQGSSGIN